MIWQTHLEGLKRATSPREIDAVFLPVPYRQDDFEQLLPHRERPIGRTTRRPERILTDKDRHRMPFRAIRSLG